MLLLLLLHTAVNGPDAQEGGEYDEGMMIIGPMQLQYVKSATAEAPTQMQTFVLRL